MEGKKIALSILLNFILINISFGETLDLNCEYIKDYSIEILDRSQKYLITHPNEKTPTYHAAKFYISDDKNIKKSSFQLSIDFINKKVIDNLGGFVAFNDAELSLTEYTDIIFIEYNHKNTNGKDYLVERIHIDRKNGNFALKRYDSYEGLDENVFPHGSLVYIASGKCKPLKRLF